MAKVFMGVRLQRLREERRMTQVALAKSLGISPSYLNQIEQNQRPLTVQVLLKLHRTLGVDIQQFSEDEEARLIAGLREALADAAEPVAVPELQEVATQMPALGRALIALHRRRLQADERLETLALGLGGVDLAAPPARRLADAGNPRPDATARALLHLILGLCVTEQTRAQLRELGVVADFDASGARDDFAWAVATLVRGAVLDG